jgi:carboxyl-terminal processing protease
MGGYQEKLDESAGADAHARAAEPVLDSLFEAFKSRKGLIIDLRFNQGGFDSVGLAWAARVANQTTVAYRKRAGNAELTTVSVTPSTRVGFRGPVVVLIGPYTVSAGETAAQALKVLSNVSTLGQSTQGALSDAIPKALPNGWRFTLSIEHFVAPTGEPLELVGIKPTHMSSSAVRSDAKARYLDEITQALALFEK